MKNAARAYEVFQKEGVISALDHAWVKVQLWTNAKKTQVQLDGCTFDLEGVPQHSTRVNLITKRYEVQERKAVINYLPHNLPVIELGGSMGVVACITNKLLDNPTAHVVIEANPLVIPHLKKSRELNRCQFEIVNKALAYGQKFVTFQPAADFFGSSIMQNGSQAPVTVEAVQLSDLIREHGFSSFSLVCDIEGLEYDLVLNEFGSLRQCAMIIMETHPQFIGKDQVNSMMEKLRSLGFKLISDIESVVVLKR
jgi:FkbM family methyltransferase